MTNDESKFVSYGMSVASCFVAEDGCEHWFWWCIFRPSSRGGSRDPGGVSEKYYKPVFRKVSPFPSLVV